MTDDKDTPPQSAQGNDSSENPVTPAGGVASINPVPLLKSGKLDLEAKSVSTVNQAWNICKQAEQNNQGRAERTADIQALHDGAPPRSAAGKTETGASWQANASTGYLSGKVGRVTLRFIKAALSQIYLTKSRLPDHIDDWKRKTDFFQARMTQLFRSWPGLTGVINRLAMEVALQGYAYAVFMDPYTWKPKMFKQDRAFIPDQSGQHAMELQYYVAKEDYLLNEFTELWGFDQEAAETAGYKIENCVEAANKAYPKDPLEDASTTQFRKYVEMKSQGMLGSTYGSSGGPVIVPTWLFWNREYDGSVSFWMIHRETGKLLRYSHKIFKSMQEVLTIFTYEPGDGTTHSSKGMGRRLANLTIMAEITRNSMVDNLRMSGMPIIQIDPASRNKMAPRVMAPFIFMPKDVTISQVAIETNSQGYAAMENMIANWAEESTGSFFPGSVNDGQDSDKTATEAKIDANREAEITDINLSRWLDQFSGMVQIMQGRADADDHIDHAWDIYQKVLANPDLETYELYQDEEDPNLYQVLVQLYKDGLSKDEIRMLRDSPVTGYSHVSDSIIQAGIGLVAQQYRGDPRVDQEFLLRRDIEGKVGPEAAEKLVVPGIDQTVQAEAARMQIMESTTMTQSGIQIPVSPRDNHLVHGSTVQQILTQFAAPAIGNVATFTDAVQKATTLNLDHLASHLIFAKQQGLDKTDEFKQLDQFYQGFKKQFTQAVQAVTQIKVAMDAAAAHSGLPAAPAGTPPGSPAPASAAPVSTGQPFDTGVPAQLSLDKRANPAQIPNATAQA